MKRADRLAIRGAVLNMLEDLALQHMGAASMTDSMEDHDRQVELALAHNKIKDQLARQWNLHRTGL